MSDEQFYDYVWDFYGPIGIYPIATLTRSDIVQATQELQACPAHEFCGDSFDRELVRDIMMAKLGVVE